MCLHAQHRKLIMLENKVVVMTAGSAADIHIAAEKKKKKSYNLETAHKILCPARLLVDYFILLGIYEVCFHD